jgi:hypothetical protein
LTNDFRILRYSLRAAGGTASVAMARGAQGRGSCV